MGHTQAEKAATHDRILTVASKRFRQFGLKGIGVADVMKEAGLTVGGFYKHFDSRDQLVLEAIGRAFDHIDDWGLRAKASLRKTVKVYLSAKHRDNLTDGCPFSLLATDVSRDAEAARDAYTLRLKVLFQQLESWLPDTPDAQRQAKIMLIFSACIGALSLSRAVSDKRFSNQILNSVAKELFALFPETGDAVKS
jgi:TetR/AcrR family transcriptional repressor of nem operon